jgi:hypothetical protein
MSGKSEQKNSKLPKPARREPQDEKHEREEGLDRTLEESFPASDPPSSIPDPEDDEDAA